MARNEMTYEGSRDHAVHVHTRNATQNEHEDEKIYTNRFSIARFGSILLPSPTPEKCAQNKP